MEKRGGPAGRSLDRPRTVGENPEKLRIESAPSRPSYARSSANRAGERGKRGKKSKAVRKAARARPIGRSWTSKLQTCRNASPRAPLPPPIPKPSSASPRIANKIANKIATTPRLLRPGRNQSRNRNQSSLCRVAPNNGPPNHHCAPSMPLFTSAVHRRC